MAANYYIDPTNGTDGTSGTIHDGLREPAGVAVYTAAAGTDATHIHYAQGGFDNDTDDNYNGDYLYNVTRSLGAIISDYDADDSGGSSVISVAIANQTAGDTFYILRAWKTLAHYTTTAADAREAGDIAYIRSLTGPGSGAGTVNTDTLAGATAIDDDGTAAAPIKVIGCDAVTNDPWHDASNTKPIITATAAAATLTGSGDDFWQFERIDFVGNTNATTATKIVSIGACKKWKFTDSNFRGQGHATGTCINSTGRSSMEFDGCSWYDNIYQSLDCTANAYINNCTFNGGAATTDYGLICNGAVILCENTNFGQTTAHDISDFSMRGGMLTARNCAFNKIAVAQLADGGELCWEDCTMPHSLASTGHANYFWMVQQDLVNVRDGGGTVSASILPTVWNSVTGGTGGVNAPMYMSGQFGWLANQMVLWGEDETAYTVTMYIRPIAAWATYPVASNLWVQASYLDHDTNHTRTLAKSTAVLTGNDGSTWVAYPVTFTCKQAGPVYLDVVMTAQEATKGIYVDLTPIVT